MIRVDPNSGVPLFRQLVDQIRLHIASGVLPAGEALPSTRALSEELGVNPMTISKAFVVLEREGLVERRPGLPLIVRQLRASTIESESEQLLRDALQQAVMVARLLDVPKEKAIEAFGEMLSDANVRGKQ